VRDWILAVCVTGLLLVPGLSTPQDQTGLVYTGLALLGASGLALGLRRRMPVVVLIITAVGLLGCALLNIGLIPPAYLIGVYTATRMGHRVATVVVSVLLFAALLVVCAVLPDGPSVKEALSEAVVDTGWLIAAAVAGEAVRQAEQRADEAERTREEITRRKVGEERLRIARELHDSLTHQISIIKVQAGVAVHLARKRGEEVPPALLAIEEASREAARELRATLGVLRGDEEVPRYGLDQLTELVERARSTGVDVTLRIEGATADLPAALERAAYRVVQEALTNVVRHAGPTTASVQVSVDQEALTVRVDDDGRATPAAQTAPGVGLIGMRERVAALGGRLYAGPREQGGFTVQAWIPVERMT